MLIYASQLYESEMRCAVVEAQVREEVVREMEERMADMEDMYARRHTRDVCSNFHRYQAVFSFHNLQIEEQEAKIDAKIDMLQRSGFSSPVKKAQPQRFHPDSSEDEEDEEEDVELSLVREESDSDQ